MAQKSFTNPCVLFDLPCRLPSGLCVGKPYWEGKYFEAGDRHHADASPCTYLDYVNKRLPRQVTEVPEEAPPEQTGTEQATVPEQAAPSALLAARRKRRG